MLPDREAAQPTDSRPRSAVAYEFARGLIYVQAANHPEWSPTRTARARLDLLLGLGEISGREYREIGSILGSLEGCDMDRCVRVDELIEEVTRDLTVWIEHYPDERLRRLEELVAIRGAFATVP